MKTDQEYSCTVIASINLPVPVTIPDLEIGNFLSDLLERAGSTMMEHFSTVDSFSRGIVLCSGILQDRLFSKAMASLQEDNHYSIDPHTFAGSVLPAVTAPICKKMSIRGRVVTMNSYHSANEMLHFFFSPLDTVLIIEISASDNIQQLQAAILLLTKKKQPGHRLKLRILNRENYNNIVKVNNHHPGINQITIQQICESITSGKSCCFLDKYSSIEVILKYIPEKNQLQ